MGKTLWLDTLAHYYDVNHKPRFKKLFGHLEIGKSPTPLASTFYVLPLNFAGIDSHNPDLFRMSFNDKLNLAAADFKERYKLSFELNERDALVTFQGLVAELKRKKAKVNPLPPTQQKVIRMLIFLLPQRPKLYVLIDEYDTSINSALGDNLLASALRVDEDDPLKRMEKIYATFFSTLKAACDADVARCFVTGVTPLALNEFTSGFNIAMHITHDLEFAPLYGFTEAEVRNGLARLPQLQPEVVDRIMDSWRRDHNGYLFHPKQEVALYNPTRVINGLHQLERTLRFDPPPATLPPESAADHLLESIRIDPNSMPAEATLAAIKHSPHASPVIEEALSSDGAELECAGGVVGQFRLAHMHVLKEDRRPLLSFMYYTGALTYARPSPDSVDSLRIPNNVARKEFAEELQRMMGVDTTGLQELRDAIMKMVNERQLAPFCQAVSRFLLRGLEGRDVRGGEDSFAQGMLVRPPCSVGTND